jgi:hypothetical protein
MKLADMVAKASPWSFEGIADKQKNIRYVGLKLKDDWLEIFFERDNLLLKFITDWSSAYVEYYLANSAPFIKITSAVITEADKWETLLGELKHRLKKDKNDFIHHKDSIDNLYARIKGQLK